MSSDVIFSTACLSRSMSLSAFAVVRAASDPVMNGKGGEVADDTGSE
jgi:hypothetical protein